MHAKKIRVYLCSFAVEISFAKNKDLTFKQAD